MDETLLQLRAKTGGYMSNEYALRVAKEEFLRSRDGFNLDADSDPVSSSVNERRKHDHYFRDVAHLSELDIYRICDLFCDDRSGAIQHAVKKLLLPGERGAGKSRKKDIQEAVDTLTRKLQMMKEDEARA